MRRLVHSFFEQYDSDKNGELDFNEFKLFFKETGFGQKLTESGLKALMGQTDTSGDQKISEEEMCELLRKVLKI